ncbi:MAG: flagellar hook-basal body complex protein FliE [Alphaproteobacteria bacterium]|nr:flagellar hook-basal body complex protein FliE [Alphaproteobacteria bacterium]
MPSIVKAYQAVKNAADIIQYKAIPTASPTIHTGNGGFMNIMKGQLEQVSHSLRTADESIKSYTMGQIAPEEMMLQTARITVETRGNIEIARSLVDTFNKIINMNI